MIMLIIQRNIKLFIKMKESKVAFLKNLESRQVKYPAYITV